ncbi:MAG TPA: GNAT family N-acetyltransferase [Acidimicrobiales bacterium]|nr:GNAT family N-acetyltransferase [Acidimicrobiales bacterium]
MEIRQASLLDPAVGPLLAGLEEEYAARYGDNHELSRTTAEEFDPPAGCFLVLVDGEVTTAGGGYRAHAEGTCEVKRMWTHPAYRRRGLAQRVLTELEVRAAAAGYRRLVLETGPMQPEAAALYQQRGYRRIETYGIYEQALAFAVDL